MPTRPRHRANRGHRTRRVTLTLLAVSGLALAASQAYIAEPGTAAALRIAHQPPVSLDAVHVAVPAPPAVPAGTPSSSMLTDPGAMLGGLGAALSTATGTLGAPTQIPAAPPRRPGTHAANASDDDGASDGSRNLALGATAHIDPSLLTARPGDSVATAAARTKLRELSAHLTAVAHAYDLANEHAAAAQAQAHAAAGQLAAAKVAAAAATRRYEQDRAALVAIVTNQYAVNPLGTLGIVMSSNTKNDVLTNMAVLQGVGHSEAGAATAAATAKQDMAEKVAQVADLNTLAQSTLAHAEAQLQAAAAAGTQVSNEVSAAQKLLQTSVLSDELGQLQAAALDTAIAAYGNGQVVFPLPKGTSFVDQHNWGARSGHWKTIHTGDDYSTSCGTPVLAATAGTIIIRTDQSWAGKWLVMDSTGTGKLTTWYAHMEALNVHNGQKVKAGDLLGLVGDLGNATGCHLHFELHPTGGSIYEDTTDPDPWLHAVGAYPKS